MLVTFHTKSYADITLFGDIAQQFLRSMGHGDSVPGALLAADIPAALAKLRASVAAAPPDQNSDRATTNARSAWRIARCR
jgi:Domain of unknown function (DUF1840).